MRKSKHCKLLDVFGRSTNTAAAYTDIFCLHTDIFRLCTND